MKLATGKNLVAPRAKGKVYEKGGKIFQKLYCIKFTPKYIYIHYAPTQKRDILLSFLRDKLSAEDTCYINYTFKEIKPLTELLEMIKRRGGKENETNQK